MGKSDQPFEVTCPDCGAVLKVDPGTRSVISHTSAPRKRTFEDLDSAARALKDQEMGYEPGAAVAAPANAGMEAPSDEPALQIA